MASLKIARESKWFNLTYNITIAIKSVDGLSEVLAGLILLVTPTAVHNLLTNTAGEASEQGGLFWTWVANQVSILNTDLASHSLHLLILFLLTHGGIKLILVYCLYKRFYRAYPYVIAVLGVMVLVQLVPLSHNPTSIVQWLMVLLDIAVIFMAWGEYQDLRDQHRTEIATAEKRAD